MVGQDLFSPSDDGVHDFAVFGDLAAAVEVSEPSQRLVGLIEVVGLIQLVELLQRVLSRSQPRMSVEQPIQIRLVGVAEMIRPAYQGEAGSEHLRFVCRGPQLRVAALYLSPYQGESFGEPPCDVEAVEHMEGVG